MSTSATTSIPKATAERVAELHESLIEIRSRVKQAAHSPKATLVAVSKYKPAADILACYEAGQRDFGENYVQELVEKASQLPSDIRWHFIGTLQSNKAKTLTSIPSLYAVQTVNSVKAATALNKNIPADHPTPLNVLIQVNTSGESNKSGISPLSSTSTSPGLTELAQHIVMQCPQLRLQGLMTIGSLTESLASEEKENEDFETLKTTRDALQVFLEEKGLSAEGGKWGEEGKLILSMGMSSDFEAALKTGSDIVRVGTGIFGSRPKKEGASQTASS